VFFKKWCELFVRCFCRKYHLLPLFIPYSLVLFPQNMIVLVGYRFHWFQDIFIPSTHFTTVQRHPFAQVSSFRSSISVVREGVRENILASGKRLTTRSPLSVTEMACVERLLQVFRMRDSRSFSHLFSRSSTIIYSRRAEKVRPGTAPQQMREKKKEKKKTIFVINTSFSILKCIACLLVQSIPSQCIWERKMDCAGDMDH
jgi:hypothetical protein